MVLGNNFGFCHFAPDICLQWPQAFFIYLFIFYLWVRGQTCRFGGHVWKDKELWREEVRIPLTQSKVDIPPQEREGKKREI